MLSQVERGETSPTLATAARIAQGLELTLSQLLRLDEADGVTVVRRQERRGGGSQRAGHTYEIVTPPLPGQRAEVSCHVLAPAAATGGPGDPPMHEPGSRETALVTQGGALPQRRLRRPQKELNPMAKTMFEKIWEAHEVAPGLIYIDLHMVHEVTSPQAFDGLRLAGRKVRRPDRTIATADHNVPTWQIDRHIADELGRAQIAALERNGAE